MPAPPPRGARALLALALAAALGACTAPPAARTGADAAAKPAPTPTTTEPTEPTATPPPAPPPTPQPGDPVTVQLAQVRIAQADNGALYGAPPAAPDAAAAERAAQTAALALGNFLTAQFTQPATWFSDAGAAALVGAGQLDEPTRQALGVLPAGTVQAVTTGEATAEADVLMAGSTVEAVSLTYSAAFAARIGDVTGPVAHTGTATFTPFPDGALALGAVVPTTTFGDPLAAVLP